MNTDKNNVPSVAVLLPCYNEALTIAKVVSDFRKALPGATIYVYDNNSTDGTAEVARQAGAVVKTEFRQGKGNVVRSMFSDIDADVYVMADGDDTYPADEAAALIEPVVSRRADMAVGDRLSSTYFSENKRRFHGGGNLLVRWLINKLYGAEIHDVLSGYRAFSRDFVKNMPVMSKGFEIETELTMFALDGNYLIKEVPVTYRDRPENSESKLNTVKDGIRILRTIFTLFRDYRPLLFFSVVAAILAVIGIVMLIPVFIDYFRTGLVERFPTLIFGCFVLLASIMFFSVGLVLEVITNQNRKLLTYLNSHNR